ncbi:MAG: hypothetical protein M3421_00525 [Bacteroidota bacterium]|jgi:hypothetical protein|nr:hypothetical protein [Bacteroidota bacterium]
MELILEFLKFLIPALLVLYAMYLMVKAFIQKDIEQKILDIKMKNQEVVLPIRLQAFERMALFLERITPNNLVLRLNDGSYSAKQFQQVLLSEVREEYYHNLSQQVYMADQTWELVKNAMEEIIVVINQAGSGLPEDAKSIDLARRIFERMLEKNNDPIGEALKSLKNEIRHTF